MSWMNASAVAAADARNRASEMELNADESPDGMGTRWQESGTADGIERAVEDHSNDPWPSDEEMKERAEKAAREEREMLAAMLREGGY